VHKIKEVVYRVPTYLAEVGVGSLLKTGITRTRTQLDVAEYFDECSVVDGAGKVHAQLINGRLRRQTHSSGG